MSYLKPQAPNLSSSTILQNYVKVLTQKVKQQSEIKCAMLLLKEHAPLVPLVASSVLRAASAKYQRDYLEQNCELRCYQYAILVESFSLLFVFFQGYSSSNHPP